MASIYQKSLVVYLILLSALLISTFSYNYMFSDEGTHLLLSLFYKDLLNNLPTLGLSYTNIYNFGLEYLVHYPKLQIAYPPVFHLTNLIPFQAFGPSIFIARIVNLLYAIGTFIAFYFLVKRFFNEKTALLSTLFFSLSSYSLLYASRAFQDFSAYFFIMLSIFVFTKALENQKTKHFLLLSITSALAILSKQISAILVIFIILYTLSTKNTKTKKIKNIAIFLIPLLLILTPYLLILQKTGGLEINRIVAVNYAGQQGEPTSLIDPIFWLYFLIQPTFFAPFTILFIAFLAFYIYKKEKHWKEFLIFFLVMYIGLSMIPNKELRFSQLFLLPAYAVASSYLLKIKNKIAIPSVLIIYLFSSLLFFYPTIQEYPQNKITEYLYKNLPAGSNIALFSDDEPLYSSVIISSLASIDKDKKITIIRPCAFGNKTSDQISNLLEESNTYFIVYSNWSNDKTIEKVKDDLSFNFSVSYNNLTSEIYTFKNFKNKKPEKLCNYICLTGEKICVG